MQIKITIWYHYMHAYVLSRFSRVWLFVTLLTKARQAPLSMRLSRQENWSGFPCSPPGDLPDPGIEPPSLMSPALAGGFFTTGTTWEATYLLGKVAKKQKTKHWQYQVLRIQSSWSSHILLMEIQNETSTVKQAGSFFIKLKTHLPYDPAIPFNLEK